MLDKKDFELENFQKGSRQTSVFISNDLWLLAKQNLIEFKSAMIFGLKFKIAEMQGFDYPQNKLLEKIEKLTKIVQEKQAEIEQLKREIPKIDPAQIEAEANEVLQQMGVEKHE